MESQNIDFAAAENVTDDNNLLDHFWPSVQFSSVANNSYIERFSPLEAFDSSTQVLILKLLL